MFRRLLPSVDSIRQSRMLSWLGPRIQEPHLWRLSRHSVARGVAIGSFFGLMIPIAQVPAAALAAFFMRGNLLVSTAATFITNPLTFGPLYYGAYWIGTRLLGVPEPATAAEIAGRATSFLSWMEYWWDRFLTHGQPLLLGMLLMAATASVVGYFATHVLWGVRVRARRRSLRARRIERARLKAKVREQAGNAQAPA